MTTKQDERLCVVSDDFLRLPGLFRRWEFEQVIEGNPHGHVHDMVGGDMGEVPTAAADPIFWVHHCHIDRLWAAWINAGAGRRSRVLGERGYGADERGYGPAAFSPASHPVLHAAWKL